MSAALNRLGVVRDVPQEVDQLIAQKHPNKKSKEDEPEPDTDTVAELATPFSPEEINVVSDNLARPDNVVAVTDNVAPKAPNFVGKTVRDVIEEATANGIQIDMLGDGLARVQNPPAGTLLTPGEHIRVRFQR
jgi:homoaconitase/3-isopropylmalate dehydratase large subunit